MRERTGSSAAPHTKSSTKKHKCTTFTINIINISIHHCQHTCEQQIKSIYVFITTNIHISNISNEKCRLNRKKKREREKSSNLIMM